MNNQTLWRKLLYGQIATLVMPGKVLDLGGSRKSGYHELIQGKPHISVVNIDQEYGYDLNFDIEKVFPLPDASYDSILCFNVLEHVFNYSLVLEESHRVLKSGGTMAIAVPFLMHVHPCPHDYWRYTAETLERICADAGFKEITVVPLGKGVFSASANLKYNVHKLGLIRKLSQWLGSILDLLLAYFDKKETYSKKYYPLGYFVTVKK
jgi:SAM-dependent methyltransferase